MAKNNALNFNLPSVDDLFSTEESRAEAKLERIVNLNPSEISNFPNHPFKVRMDSEMLELIDSVKQHGILLPALVRPKPEGGYEMVSGHRRKKAAELAGFVYVLKKRGVPGLSHSFKQSAVCLWKTGGAFIF